MTLLISWLVATLVIGALIAASSRWLGPEMLTAVYVGSLVMAIVVAGKLGTVPGLPQFTLSASIFVYSATFIFTDVLSEVWGKKQAQKAVWAGAMMYPLLFITTQFAVIWEPHPFWAEQQEAFASTMTTTLRIVIASFAAYLVGQLHDVWAFHFWRARTKGKHLWLRNNLSTMTSQAIDTLVFYFVGFYGVFPLGRLILLTYLIKLAIAAIDTPVVYAVVGLIRRGRPDLQESAGALRVSA